MNAREYLTRYKKALISVRQYEERVEDLTIFLRGIEMDGQPKGTKTGDPTGNSALNLVLLKEQLTLAKLDAETIKHETALLIDKVNNQKSRELLYSRYVLLMPWTKVVQRLDILRPGKEYELKSVMGYLHRKALKDFQEVLNEICQYGLTDGLH